MRSKAYIGFGIVAATLFGTAVGYHAAAPTTPTVINNRTFGGWAWVPIEIGGAGNQQQWRLQYKTDLVNIKQGQIIDVTSQLIVANNTGINAEIDDIVTIHSAWPPAPGYNFVGVNFPLAPAPGQTQFPSLKWNSNIMGENVTPVPPTVGRHYIVRDTRLLWQADADYQYLAVASWLMSASTDAKPGMYVVCTAGELLVRIDP